MDYFYLLKEAEGELAESDNDLPPVDDDAESPAEDNTDGEEPKEDETDDDIPEEEGEEAPPIDEDSPMGDEDTVSDGTSGDVPEDSESTGDVGERKKNLALYGDMQTMITGIKGMIMKLSDITSNDLLITKISFQVKTNLEALVKQLYNYLFTTFRDSNYITNLYNYTMFKEALSMNVRLLKSVEEIRSIKTNK